MHGEALILAREVQSLARKVGKPVLAAIFHLDRAAKLCGQGFLPCGQAFVACTGKFRGVRPGIGSLPSQLGALRLKLRALRAERDACRGAQVVATAVG
ncbi:MAG: hypothetical protein CRU78_19045 [Candidatus Accumulibacter phosphatis]|uniref:Uncharacterized protein n=1 Tax=Candidatus Accumulibacter phosphatis TaxID=327160 RepID=A0A6A7RZP1_9PROT|nr:hypothetical protein [Candidatus Accumulibacter phosphatis]